MRTEIEQIIAKLSTEIEQRNEGAQAATETKSPPAQLPATPVSESVSVPPPTAPTSSTPLDTTPPRIYRRPWFGAVVGIASVLLAGAVVTGAVLATRPDPIKETLPTVRF